MMRYKVRKYANHVDDGWEVIRYWTGDEDDLEPDEQYISRHLRWSTAVAVADDLAQPLREMRAALTSVLTPS